MLIIMVTNIGRPLKEKKEQVVIILLECHQWNCSNVVGMDETGRGRRDHGLSPWAHRDPSPGGAAGAPPAVVKPEIRHFIIAECTAVYNMYMPLYVVVQARSHHDNALYILVFEMR